MREHHKQICVSDIRQNEPNETRIIDTLGFQECVGTLSAHKWEKLEYVHQHHTYEGKIPYVKWEPYIYGGMTGIIATAE